MTKTILPAPNTAAYPYGFFNADKQRAWDEGRAGEDALNANQNLKANYLNIVFNRWFISYDDARDRTTPPPQPPNSFVAVMQEIDYANGAIGDPWDLVQGGPPVCEMPNYLAAVGTDLQDLHMMPPPQVAFSVGDVVTAEPSTKDNMPVGFKVTQDDGSQWVKKVRMTPFGAAYMWVRVA